MALMVYDFATQRAYYRLFQVNMIPDNSWTERSMHPKVRGTAWSGSFRDFWTDGFFCPAFCISGIFCKQTGKAGW